MLNRLKYCAIIFRHLNSRFLGPKKAKILQVCILISILTINYFTIDNFLQYKHLTKLSKLSCRGIVTLHLVDEELYRLYNLSTAAHCFDPGLTFPAGEKVLVPYCFIALCRT